MTTQVQLAYLLGKDAGEDLFNSELLVPIPVQGNIDYLTSDEMTNTAAGPTIVLGVWLQQSAGGSTLRFVRKPAVGDVPFLGITQEKNKFKKLRFRMITTTLQAGQEVNVAMTYEVDDQACEVTENIDPGQVWLALVTFDGVNFQLHCKKGGAGPGGGPDPCQQLDCLGTDDWVTKVKCIYIGCPT